MEDNRKRKIRRHDLIHWIFGTAAILTGLLLFFYPEIQTVRLNCQTDRLIRHFREVQESTDAESASETPANSILQEESGNPEPEPDEKVQPETEFENAEIHTEELKEQETKNSDSLYQRIRDYNETLYETSQQSIGDAWSVSEVPEELSDLTGTVFGYLEIPKMDVTLPLLIGASESNLARGAAILGQTSLPIGGENTNSVIAGHRGYQGAPYFREIERLSAGDYVFITNAWEKLAYRVEEIAIIAPYDTDQILIREGKDMITLLTCHPYRSRGTYRYLVTCVRDSRYEEEQKDIRQDTDTVSVSLPAETGTGTSENTSQEADTSDRIRTTDGSVFESSEPDILLEQWIRRLGGLTILILVAVTIVRNHQRKGRKQ